jgi:hypothetical protein
MLATCVIQPIDMIKVRMRIPSRAPPFRFMLHSRCED